MYTQTVTCDSRYANLFLLTAHDGTTGTLAGTSVGLGLLPANGEPTTMAQTAIAADVHQALDVGGDFTTKITLNFVVIFNLSTDDINFISSEIVGIGFPINACRVENFEGHGPADAVDVGQRNIHALISRQIYTSYTCHSLYPLSLTLFVSGILTDHPQNTVTPDYFALGTHFLNRRSDFHDRLQTF